MTRERWILAGTLALILAGVTLRVLGYFGDEMNLWQDEAIWGRRTLDANIVQTGRPLGYMWLTWLVTRASNSEQALRFLPWFGGLLSLPLGYLCARQVTKHWVAAAFVLYLLGINSFAIAMAKEAKPYSLELMLHFALIASALLYVHTQARRYALIAALLPIACAWLTWSVTFLLPGLFMVLLVTAWRARDRLTLAAISAGAFVTLLELLLIFSWVQKLKTRSSFWAKKYGVFPTGKDNALKWFIEKTIELSELPTILKLEAAREPLLFPLSVFIGLLFAGALVTLAVQKRWQLALLLVSPLLVTAAFSAFGKWPYGVFRTNLFLLAYVLLLAAIGLDGVLRLLPARARVVASVVVGAVALSVVPVDLERFTRKEKGDMAYSTSFRVVVPLMDAYEKANDLGRPPILGASHSCSIMPYYQRYNDETKEFFSAYLKDRRLVCKASVPRQMKRAKTSFWVLFAGFRTKGSTRRWLRNARCKDPYIIDRPLTVAAFCKR